MSTNVTVAVAKPNHRPVNVFTETKAGAQWLPESSTSTPVGGAETFLVHGSRRLVIEEVSE
jgi:hypothetical protein